MKKKAQKEPVRLREKKLSNGNISLYLDYYNAGERQYEFLKLYLIDKPKTALDKQSNQTTLELALRIKAKRTEEVLTGAFDLPSKGKGTANFVSYYQAYFTSYTKKDHRVLSASLSKFKDYLQEAHGKERLAFKDLTPNLVLGFKDFLEAKLTGEGPQTYYSRFKKVVKHGIRENLFPQHPLPENVKFKGGGMNKGLLSLEEVSLLAKTHCGSDTIKRAFLFACNTGLRFGDIKALKWQDISGVELAIKQSKTQEVHRLRLNQNALKLNLLHLGGHRVKRKTYNLTLCHKREESSTKNSR